MLDAKGALELSRFFIRREKPPQSSLPADIAKRVFLARAIKAFSVIAFAARSKCRFPSVPPPAPLQRLLEAEMEKAILEQVRWGLTGTQFIISSEYADFATPGLFLTRQTWRAAFDWMLFTLAALGYAACCEVPSWMNHRFGGCAPVADLAFEEYREFSVTWKEAKDA